MSERDVKDWLLVLTVSLLLFAAYSEIDSWFWRSQIRDLQRRVGALESERR